MNVAFLLNDLQLSGGVGVVVQHARRLSTIPGWDVTLVMVRDEEAERWHGYEHLPHLHVRTRAEAMAEAYDVAVATWWETTFTLFELTADRYAFFVQSLEDRFYRDDQLDRLAAGLTLDLPVSFITEAQWIRDTLRQLRPDAPCHLVRNGIDKDVFAPVATVAPATGAALRVLIEGAASSWFKQVPDAITAAAAMREPHHVTVVSAEREALGDAPADEVIGPLTQREMAALYRESHVVLKLSRVEGVFGPPLEGFHGGATCVVTPVTGYEEYVEHGVNGLLTDWDDLLGTARQLDLLARDRRLLHHLRAGALATARGWPSWEQSTQFMALALLAIVREPSPSASRAARRLLADLRGGVEIHDLRLREQHELARRALRIQGRVERIRASRPARWARRLRRRRAVRLLARPFRPLLRRARRAVS